MAHTLSRAKHQFAFLLSDFKASPSKYHLTRRVHVAGPKGTTQEPKGQESTKEPHGRLSNGREWQHSSVQTSQVRLWGLLLRSAVGALASAAGELKLFWLMLDCRSSSMPSWSIPPWLGFKRRKCEASRDPM